MGYKQNRRIVKFGAVSKGIVLPKGWTEFYGLQCGDGIVILGDSVLVIAASKKEEEKARRVLELIERAPSKAQK